MVHEIIKEKTGIDLNLYELYDNEANSGNKKKDYRMDAVFRGSESTVIIEVNNGNAKMSEIKMYFYLHRVQGDHLEEGEKYRPYRTTLIAFNNYRNPKTPNLEIAHYKMTEQTTRVTKDFGIESYEISLPKIHEKRYNEITNEIDKRLWILGVRKMEELKPLDLSEENIKIINESKRLLREDARYGLVYNVEEEQQRMINTVHAFGYEEGEEAGAKQKAIETAKTLLKIGVGTIEQIAEATKLSIEEIEKLKEE